MVYDRSYEVIWHDAGVLESHGSSCTDCTGGPLAFYVSCAYSEALKVSLLETWQ
jgi:hypothetical protein